MFPIINKILHAVTRKIDQLLPDVKLYINNTKQDLEEPCFFIRFLDCTQKKMIGKRHFKENGMVIQYLHENDHEDLYKISEILMNQMDLLVLEDGTKVRGSKKSTKIEEGVLTFHIHYNFFGIEEFEIQENMDQIEISIQKEE